MNWSINQSINQSIGQQINKWINPPSPLKSPRVAAAAPVPLRLAFES